MTLPHLSLSTNFTKTVLTRSLTRTRFLLLWTISFRIRILRRHNNKANVRGEYPQNGAARLGTTYGISIGTFGALEKNAIKTTTLAREKQSSNTIVFGDTANIVAGNDSLSTFPGTTSRPGDCLSGAADSTAKSFIGSFDFNVSGIYLLHSGAANTVSFAGHVSEFRTREKQLRTCPEFRPSRKSTDTAGVFTFTN